ncbi:MAG TPA: hypothetical protein VMU26_29440 [Candidatus Polarisedimenticolia bacterium]|nr:hypothetical protein [Candidatus Polarisedimenticolia bacterium]
MAELGKGYVEKKLNKDERSASQGTITTRVEQKQVEERLAVGDWRACGLRNHST